MTDWWTHHDCAGKAIKNSFARFENMSLLNNMRGTVLILLTAASLAATAQHLPPVFAGKSAKTDSLTRAYITPERVVWAHGGVKQQDILLREGTGQPDMAGMPAVAPCASGLTWGVCSGQKVHGLHHLAP